MDAKLTPERLQRKALVYVRQSSMTQVTHNLESQRRQYALPARAQELGFQSIEVIDDDQGRSGSGCVERPGFERLVAQVCSGEIGGVICVEASRLARNGRDWHHLLELCALVGTVIVDPEGVYDPSLSNDRLLLGLKGTMSEFEVSLFRQRSREATQQKARRGELQFRLPAGLCWNGDHIELDPDQRIQQVFRLIFQKLEELGSVRQVYLWLSRQKLQVPVRTSDGKIAWKPPRYTTILYLFFNPFYAGAYAFGRTQVRTRVVDGRARKFIEERRRHQERWSVLIQDHHPGYISWEQYERNLRTMEANAHMKASSVPKAGRGGRALLSGLLRCRRCGRLMNVYYRGDSNVVARYICRGWPHLHPESHVAFGGVHAEEIVVAQLLEAVSGNAIQAALEAADQERSKQGEHRRCLELALEQACYQARLAERRYEEVDPSQRLVARELEARWNVALERVREAEAKCVEFDRSQQAIAIPSQELLLSLAEDLPAVWNASTDMRLKQRIIHLVLREILADVDPRRQEVSLLLHWAGGRHSEVRWTKTHSRLHEASKSSAMELIGKMAGAFQDQQIAFTLNRARMKTEWGQGWSAEQVARARKEQKMPEFGETVPTMTLEQAAQREHVSKPVIRRLIKRGILPAQQVVEFGPWQISAAALDSENVRKSLERTRGCGNRNFSDDRQQYLFSAT